MTRDNRFERGAARDVILLIGDGMGQAHRLGGQLLVAGRTGRLAMDRLPYVGMMGTTSADPATFVTDSAAAATALATGVKTANGAVSVDLAGRPLTTLMEFAKRAGKAVGLVTTCQVTDATPAAFAAHVPHRSDQSEIARQFIAESRVDVILGGGAAHWLPPELPPLHPADPEEPSEESRGTAGDLVTHARQLGYAVVTSSTALSEAVRAERVRPVLGLFANQELFRQRAEGLGDRYEPPVSLAEMTRAAIALLSRAEHGFVLMVEESAIDRMAHRNNGRLTLQGVVELDRAVQVALAHAGANPETLVVVTADHECGGLAVAGADDPRFPYEPGGGLLDTVTADEDGPFPVADGGYAFSVGWATTGHTASPVPLTAMGPGAERLSGIYENTFPFSVLTQVMGLAPRNDDAVQSNGQVAFSSVG